MLALLLFSMMTKGALYSPVATEWYRMLLAEGGFGRLEREQAAFLIQERDGTLTLEPWENGGFRHARFRGPIPAGAIAILHTHPASLPHPSAGDRAEARRLGLAVVVITPDSVRVAWSDGGEGAIEGRRGWSSPTTRATATDAYFGENARPRLRNDPAPLRPTN